MTPIEDLLREALATTPEPAPSADPLGMLDRRVRRARRRLAAGAGVVAAVIAAAIVVPLTVGGGGAPSSVQVVSPQPSGTPSPPPRGTTALWTGNAVWVSTSPSGQRWMLYNDGGQPYVTRVTGKREKPIAVRQPADYIVAGDQVVWVIGGGGSTNGGPGSVVTAIDAHQGTAAAPLFENKEISFGAVVSGSLYVDATDASGTSVERIDVRNDTVTAVDSKPVPRPAEMVATLTGSVWVHSASKLLKIEPTATGFDLATPVPWGAGQLFAPTLPRSAPGGVWAYDGSRLIALMPSALAGCVSCAEGDRVTVPGKPGSVVEQKDGLYVAVPGSGLYYYSPDALGSGETPVTASIKGVQVITMTADPVGGVDYVDDQGNLIHWQPVAR